MPATAPNPIKLRWFFWTPLSFALFVIIGFYSVRMTQNYNSFEDQRAAARYETLHKLQADEQATLTTADWVDQGKKIVRIPIDEAMAEEIDVLKAKPLAMGSLIPVTNAAPAATAPAASSTNTAPAANAAPATNAPPAAPAKPAPSTTQAPTKTTAIYSADGHVDLTTGSSSPPANR
ncbi:MAG: hypothetical protein LV481_01125 [Methylacidiphilales bacterium]|nr:hypothetical protein [Candidatus Methylacidiphilales bacterium]